LKIFLIVEGPSDELVFRGQCEWFDSLGIDLHVRMTNGKKDMIKSALKHYRIAVISNADYIIFLPDLHGDSCALVTRQQIDMDSKDKVYTIVVKPEIEAWILADGQCIQNCISMNYSPHGQTDVVAYPKQKLKCELKRKLGYLPESTMEVARIVAPHFSIQRAARNNTSAKRFKELIEMISLSSC